MAAEKLIREAVDIVERTDFLFDRGTVQLDLAEVMHSVGRDEEARAARERALEMFEEKGDLDLGGEGPLAARSRVRFGRPSTKRIDPQTMLRSCGWASIGGGRLPGRRHVSLLRCHSRGSTWPWDLPVHTPGLTELTGTQAALM